MSETFRRELELAARADDVFDELAAPAGLRRWWTTDCEGDASRFTVRFGTTRKTMRVDARERPTRVEWACVDAHLDVPTVARRNEWRGTTIRFAIAPLLGGRSRLTLEHVGLTPDVECYAICAAGWDQFLGSLRSLVETGVGAPFTGTHTPAAPASPPA